MGVDKYHGSLAISKVHWEAVKHKKKTLVHGRAREPTVDTIFNLLNLQKILIHFKMLPQERGIKICRAEARQYL